jgi:hypothetical protein
MIDANRMKQTGQPQRRNRQGRNADRRAPIHPARNRKAVAKCH